MGSSGNPHWELPPGACEGGLRHLFKGILPEHMKPSDDPYEVDMTQTVFIAGPHHALSGLQDKFNLIQHHGSWKCTCFREAFLRKSKPIEMQTKSKGLPVGSPNDFIELPMDNDPGKRPEILLRHGATPPAFSLGVLFCFVLVRGAWERNGQKSEKL